MIPDETPGGPAAAARWSRRDVLKTSLAALTASSVVGGLVGSLAGCGSTSSTFAPPPRTPTPSAPLVPSRPITVGNAASIKRLAALQPMNHRVRGVALSPDGRLVATGSNPEVALWDSATGKRLATLNGHTGQIFSMAWSPASKLLASAADDGTVRLWDAQAARARQTLKTASNASFLSVAWSPDGHQVVAGTPDGDVARWNAQTGAQIATWSGPAHQQGHGGEYPFAVWGVSWSPDGRQIVSTRYDDLILLWDVATGRSQGIPKTDTQPNTVAWSPDGRQFAVTDDEGKVILWNGATGARGKTFEGHDGDGWAYGLAWSPDGSMVASSRHSGLVQLWDARTGTELVALNGHLNAVWGLAWSSDGLRLASASDDGSVCLWGVV
ncbi:MAG TPA: WD40 repeat domain-containing protein [Ktedonobacterales bacterium]|nr:WD40 repeat domain-containing protein [Ktedonobacterales bacterium]